MTASYSELQTGESAAEVASELHRHMLNDAGQWSGPQILELVDDRLAFAPSHSAADALALTNFADMMLKAALLHLPDEDVGEAQNARFFIAVARVMAERSITALEGLSGFARESFDLERRTPN